MKRTISLLLLLLVLAGLIFGMLFYGLKIRNPETPVVEVTEERKAPVQNIEIAKAGDIEIVHDYLSYDHSRRTYEIREIKYIVIHETDNRNLTSDAKAHSDFLHKNQSDITSWHYTVDDHSIYHHVPDNEVAFNAGDGRTRNGGNMNGIGIEMCVSMGIDYDQTLINTANLAAALMVNYDLTPDALKFHQDFMNKICPHRLITEGRKEEFEGMVKDAYDKLMAEKEEVVDE